MWELDMVGTCAGRSRTGKKTITSKCSDESYQDQVTSQESKSGVVAQRRFQSSLACSESGWTADAWACVLPWWEWWRGANPIATFRLAGTTALQMWETKNQMCIIRLSWRLNCWQISEVPDVSTVLLVVCGWTELLLNAMCCWSMKSLSQFCLKVSFISARNGIDGLGWSPFLFWGGWGAQGTCGPDGSVNCQMFTHKCSCFSRGFEELTFTGNLNLFCILYSLLCKTAHWPREIVHHCVCPPSAWRQQ